MNFDISLDGSENMGYEGVNPDLEQNQPQPQM
jgi:hypothetical protein